MRLVVGLGNPGSKYARTRHNAGFLALEILARRHGITLGQKRFSSVVGSGRIAGCQVLLAQPQTYMNLSGRAVRLIFDYYHLDVADLLILHDDMDIDLGLIKVVPGGRPGGHKGVASVAEVLGGNDFTRIKIGVGRPVSGQPAEDYVLSNFGPDQEDLVERVLDGAATATEVVISGGVAEAQRRFNRKVLNAKEEEVRF